MKKNYLSFFLTFCLVVLGVVSGFAQSTVSATYSLGDIPTSYDSYDASCTGPSTTLDVSLPAGGPWQVTGFDVAYDMTAASGAWMSEQRSQIAINGIEEAVVNGSGSSAGTQNYNRTNIAIANGFYNGGDVLTFEMKAWRTWGGSLCDTQYNKVDDNTWTITVNYQPAPTCIAPNNLQVSNKTNTTLDLSWSQTGTVSSWEVEYGAPGFTQGAGTTVVVNTNPNTTITGLTDSTTYDFYVRANCGANGDSAWVGPISGTTTIDCGPLNLGISSTTDGSITCAGSTVLTATASGNGSDIFWYDAAVGGNLVGAGSSFTTPYLTQTTTYYASEVAFSGGSSGGSSLPTYCTPTYSIGCTSSDDIDDFIMSDAGINHLGSGCSTGAYGDFTNDSSLIGTLSVGSTYNFSATHNFSNHHLRIYIDLNMDGNFDPSEMLFDSPNGGSTTNGSITIPASVGGATVMRVMGKYGSFGSGATACDAGGSFGETHDYQVIIADLECESPRVAATANVSAAGDLAVTALPYNNSNDTANYGDPFEGTPGANCGAGSENYLSGNDVIYKYTAANTELVDILMSNLSGYYAGVFVYESCGDLGVNCVAGAVAGPSDDDFGIEDFQMTAGQDYFIVVSSWLTSTVGYTLDIIPFSCASLASPVADPLQDFVAGDTLADLEVDTTKNTATLAWYSDPQGNNPIADTSALVDGVTYYVAQVFNGCESALTPITVDEIDCTSLAITATTDDTVSCKGVMQLSATPSGTGSEVFWYDAATGGQIVGVGNQFTTDELTATTSYWASEVMLMGGGTYQDQGKVTPNDFSSTPSTPRGLTFTVNQFTTILSTRVYSSGSGGPLTVELTDDNGTVLQSKVINIPAGSSSNPVPVDLSLNFTAATPGNYRLLATGPAMMYSFSGVNFPYTLGSTGSITGAYAFGGPSTSYYFFNNWKVIEGEVICESPRTEVIATVNQSGDIALDHTNLPYTDTNTTSVFGDNFNGDAGSNCPGVDILNGNDVVYQYTADPNNDDILDIELTGITNNFTGMFIYTSCGDVGTNCLAGDVNEGASSILIEDYYVNAGEQIFIVISSKNGSTNYTLNINGVDCNNIAAPTTDVASPFFTAGDTLADLEIEGSQYATSFNWYSDAAGTMPISDTTAMVDGVTYYVSQTVLGCEGALLAVTPEEFDCNAMGVTISGPTKVCAPGGVVDLVGQPSGLGTDVYWYDAPTGGNVVNVGANFAANVTATTTFYATEVYIEGGSGSAGVAYCIPPNNNCGAGDDIDDFDMASANIVHLSSGCSTNGYGDFTSDPNLIGAMVPGGNYPFSITHNFSSNYVKIWIDLNKDGVFDDSTELLFASSSGSNNTTGSITLPANTPSGLTRMRVMDRYASLPVDSCDPQGSFGETHDYAVMIGQVLCESPRQSITIDVNNQPTAVPTGNASQQFCEGARVGDLQASGVNLQWYDSNTSTAPLDNAMPLVDGSTYYATQTVDACESTARLEVMVSILPNSSLPTAQTNQSFVAGETVMDLTVVGDNLKWYYDAFGANEITNPAAEVLVDQGKYYVSQTPANQCESGLVEITVHSELSTSNPLLVDLSYYPNPMEDFIQVNHSNPIETIEIYNLLGQKVMTQSVNAQQSKLEVTNLASGPYFMRVSINAQSVMLKLVKK